MSGGVFCRCEERNKPIEERQWVVDAYRCNHSAFNGHRYTPSAYSAVSCTVCGYGWRTKAAYVEKLLDNRR